MSSNNTPSHVAGVARYLLQHLRSARAGGPERPAGALPTLEFSSLAAPEDRVARYLRVTQGERIAGLAPGRLLPPTFPAVWETAAILDLLRLGRYPLPVQGLIHVGSERIFVRSVEADDAVRLKLKLGAAERARSGARVLVQSKVMNGAGQLCSETQMQLLLRGMEAGGGARSKGEGDSAAPPEDAEWSTLRGWSLEGGLGRSYAAVSGDFNPIHLFRATARPLGFDRPILHGCCIEAMVAHALIESVLGGDPEALRRLAITFKAPVEIPGEVYLQTLNRPGGGWFRVTGSQAGPALSVGEWTGAAPAPQG